MSRKKKADKKDFLIEGSDWEFSLSKFVGKKIVDIIGYPSDPFGGTPLFAISQIVFEDGTKVSVEGEHDVAYIPADDKLNNMNEDTLQCFIEE
jgi:hypothetical protein